MSKINVEFVLGDTGKILLDLHDSPAEPQVGDLTIGPDGIVYRIVQRAFLIKNTSILTHGAAQISLQCVLIPQDILETYDERGGEMQ